jgi:hypothetical protein
MVFNGEPRRNHFPPNEIHSRRAYGAWLFENKHQMEAGSWLTAFPAS